MTLTKALRSSSGPVIDMNLQLDCCLTSFILGDIGAMFSQVRRTCEKGTIQNEFTTCFLYVFINVVLKFSATARYLFHVKSNNVCHSRPAYLGPPSSRHGFSLSNVVEPSVEFMGPSYSC